MNRMHIQTSLLTAAITFASALAGVAQATPADGTINLLTTPPELTAKVAPNVVLTFDDSGSMSWHHMPDYQPYQSTDKNWASGIPATSDISETASSTFASAAGPYLCAGMIDPKEKVSSPANPRSWTMNGVYYNPNITYDPPIGVNGDKLHDSSFTAAWVNGIRHNRGAGAGGSASSTYNLTNTNTNQGKRFCGNMPGYYRLKDGVALNLDVNGRLDSASVTRLYNSGNWEWVDLPAGEQTNFANWFSYYRTRQMAAITATSRAYASFDKGVRVAWQNINASPQVANGTTRLAAFEGSVRSDFYSWLLQNPARGSTPNRPASKRVGELFSYGENVSDSRNPYWDVDTGRELACRKNFHIQMTDGYWNSTSATVSQTDTAAATLPDGRSYSTSDLQSKIYWNEGGPNQRTMANIAFHYWATDLRPDFKNNVQTKFKVRPYLSDRTTGVTGSVPLNPGDNWLDNKEVYWNPANNPATWPHLVQYMIGFGVDGTIPKSDSNYEKLRKGTLAWPALTGSDPYGQNGGKIDDMWHAAINSRGQFFTAANPEDLIDAIRRIIASVVAQSTSSTPASVSLPILTGGNSFYEGGYDSSGWLGSLRRRSIDSTGTPGAAAWDAGCLLTGGQCADPTGSSTARDPNSRILFTSDGAGAGKAFRWGSLTNPQKYALNQKPGAAACASTGTSTTCDGHGSARVDYIRGDRTKESATATPSLRSRLSVLGSIINAEPVYVSSPRAGYRDMFPVGSPEATAAALSEGSSYAGYQNAERDRRPTVYAGSNDGMLHAFDAKTGKEQWAYVPDLVIRNGRLHAMTLRDSDLVPGVDSAARERDVFINGSWRTILLGSLRLGGRGVYALDVTDPVQAGESNSVALWEFTSGNVASTAGDAPCAAGVRSCPSLGYTYDSANVARIKHDNKWVAVVSSGYFPENPDAAAKPGDATEAAAKRTSLLVIDLETGQLIREIRTSSAPEPLPTGFLSYGLSTPMVYDEGSDQIDDLVYAGDLAGNLWRFDLSDANPANWKVNLMFTTYGSTGGATAAGNQPIVFNPTAMRDPVTRRPILVVGTGKYLGEPDRTSLIPQQSFYGIRDYGTNSTNYPIRVEQLVTQNISQTGSERRVTSYTAPSSSPGSSAPVMRMASKNAANNPIVTDVHAHGWRMPLNIVTERGERAQRRAIPLTTANVTLLYGLIPKSDDPCDPGARYSVMALDGATGAALAMGAGEIAGTGQGIIGGVAQAPSPPADPVMVRGGGKLVIPGLSDQLSDAVKDALNAAAPPWHRGAWRDLLDW